MRKQVPVRMPPTPTDGDVVVAKSLTLQGQPVRLADLKRGENVGDGGILPDAKKGQALIFNGDYWESVDLFHPNPEHWDGAPASIGEAINRLAETVYSMTGAIE